MAPRNGMVANVEVCNIDGKTWFRKQNPSQEITDIELKIYKALKADSMLQQQGVPIPEARVDTQESTILVEDCGTTLDNYLHLWQYGSIAEMRLEFTKFLDAFVPVRSRVNKVINDVLTDPDKEFLKDYAFERPLGPMTKIAPGAGITKEDIKRNYWAYKIMASCGKYDEEFKHAYTRVIGKKLDGLLEKYGAWTSDASLRNMAVGSDAVVPFDFNSIKFNPHQMDFAPSLGLYLFHGPLETCRTDEERREKVEWLQYFNDPEANNEDYFKAFIISSFHHNLMVAANRGKQAKKIFESLATEYETKSLYDPAKHMNCWMAFDEIDYHEAAAMFAFDSYRQFFQETPQDREDVSRIRSFYDNTAGCVRVSMMFNFQMRMKRPLSDEVLWKNKALFM